MRGQEGRGGRGGHGARRARGARRRRVRGVQRCEPLCRSRHGQGQASRGRCPWDVRRSGWPRPWRPRRQS
eukprot:3280964-Pyramimonas_sp.AAC.1